MTADHIGVDSILYDSGGHSAVLVLNSKPFPQGGIGHEIPLHISQAGVKVTGPNSILFVHFPQFPVGEQNRSGVFCRGFKQGRRELVKFGLKHYLIHAATALFADANAAHERC